MIRARLGAWRASEHMARRWATALENVAKRTGYPRPPTEGRARGIAAHQTSGTIVAQVAEVSIDAGRLHVHQVWGNSRWSER
jgi:isoquinoline 1-oxidoreductase beta subunit